MKSQLQTLYKRVAGTDVHRMKLVVTVLAEDEDGDIARHTREFGGFCLLAFTVREGRTGCVSEFFTVIDAGNLFASDGTPEAQRHVAHICYLAAVLLYFDLSRAHFVAPGVNANGSGGSPVSVTGGPYNGSNGKSWSG